MKPVIGITTFFDNKETRLYNSLGYSYINSVYNAGGIPMLIPIITDDRCAADYLDMTDGLLLSGGEDISPMLYGENPIKEVNLVSEERDYMEFGLFREALRRDMPVLGICRGIQLINAACGGTLYQDIHVQGTNILGHSPRETWRDALYHPVQIKKDSRLYSIFNSEHLKVNSFHHQAVRTPAANFRVTAVAPDGIIEGIEDPGKSFVVGVQWHPEDLTMKYPEFLKLFRAFIHESECYKEKSK